MSLSLFDLQREHYEVKETKQTLWLENLDTDISCTAPKFELCCGSYLEPATTGISMASPAKMQKVSTKNLPVYVKCNYPDYEDEFIINSWEGIDDIPEDAFISLTSNEYNYETSSSFTHKFYNSIIVDQNNKKIYLKKLIKKIQFTGDENWWYHQGTGSYICSFPEYEGFGRCYICSHMRTDKYSDSYTLTTYGMNNYFEAMFYNMVSKYSSLASWKQALRSCYANGEPVTIWLISQHWMTIDELEATAEIIDITETSPKLAKFLLEGGSLKRPFRQRAGQSYEVSLGSAQLEINYTTQIKISYLTNR